jgi:hypothetical protein
VSLVYLSLFFFSFSSLSLSLSLAHTDALSLFVSIGGGITRFIGARHPDFIHKKHPDFGKKENPDLEWYVERAVNGTLEATGVSAELVEKAWIGNFAGELFSSQVNLVGFSEFHIDIGSSWCCCCRIQSWIGK